MKDKYCKCVHPINEKGERVFLAGGYRDEKLNFRCGYCNGIITLNIIKMGAQR